jgi:type II restriction/modification system DNA methylase subunit YeeA
MLLDAHLVRMNPAEFAEKWIGNTNTERAAAQEHFIDLCGVVGARTPNSDKEGESYAFERGVSKTGGGEGWADVWLRGNFGWEYKSHHKDLEAAYSQLLKYREALENPPLLVVCDLDRFIVRTNFTNTVRAEYTFTLEDLRAAPKEPLRILRALFENPEELRPSQTREQLTEQAAGTFAQLALELRQAGYEPQRVAHFLNKLLFMLFAEDAKLLPAGLVRDLGKNLRSRPDDLSRQLAELFRLMSTKPGGTFGPVPIEWFNGGLFDGEDVLPLTTAQIDTLVTVSLLDWSQVEPAIFGTLFERGLDPDKRSQLGAHYTDRRSIERVVYPVVIEPLQREWEGVKEEIGRLLEGHDVRRLLRGGAKGARTRVLQQAYDLVTRFLGRLDGVRVLDPACGSGNFLYVALQALKDLEREVLVWETSALGTSMRFPALGPHNVRGIELNSYAAELARVAIWIGEIQWMIGNGFAYLRDPILRPLEAIELRDALLDLRDSGSPGERQWPDAEMIVGNPPFLGVRGMRASLGDAYVEALFRVYEGRVPHEADLVCYWHEKARAMVEAGRCRRAGLLATQTIRAGANRHVLDRIRETGSIFMAWSDQPWVVEGAAIRVSIVAYDDGTETSRTLNGEQVTTINPNLTSTLDVTRLRTLPDNAGIAFQGMTKGGHFELTPAEAAALLTAPNPDNRSNEDVIKPWINGMDVARRSRGMFIIDFGVDMPIEEAALYEAPFALIEARVKPEREHNRRAAYRERWWIFDEARPGLRQALRGLSRYIVTPRVTKHRIFAWIPVGTIPDTRLIAFAREDDYLFGVLHARPHEVWSTRTGNEHGVGATLTYIPATTFGTFPFPRPTAEQAEAITAAAQRLDVLRNGWLSASSLSAMAARDRTLTNLYNEKPAWLRQAHERMDRAVHGAYGWPYPLDDEDVLARLLVLNQERADSVTGPAAEVDT